MGTHFGLLSTYPPTQCGLATFTQALAGALVADGGEVSVISSLEVAGSPRAAGRPAGPVVGELVAGDASGAVRAAELLDRTDVVIVQHEYGIYGGVDGAEVLDVLRALAVPVVVVLHTVLAAPTAGQRAVLEAVTARADAVVTMSSTARDRLAAGYDVDLTKVSVIPHGAPEVARTRAPLPRAERGGARPTVLTWGLLGPGKGIEWAVEAMSLVRRTVPSVRYVIAGQTHPKVLAHAGESYRRGLEAQVRRLRLGDTVEFEPAYRDAAGLADLIDSADVVLLPYDNTEQVTSGVLIEAVASVTPVVATRFPHAVELLGGGTGLLVARRDPAAMAAALESVLTEPGIAAGMRRAAASSAPGMRWSAIAARYRTLTDSLVRAGIAA